MASNALARAEEKIANMKERAARARAAANATAKTLQRDGIAVVSAYAYGKVKKDRRTRNLEMPTIAGLDPEVTAVAALYIISQVADGEIAEVAHDAALGIACGAAYNKAIS